MNKLVSINGICHIRMLDDNEMELTMRSDDTEIHHGELESVTIDLDNDTFTVTYEPLD